MFQLQFSVKIRGDESSPGAFYCLWERLAYVTQNISQSEVSLNEELSGNVPSSPEEKEKEEDKHFPQPLIWGVGDTSSITGWERGPCFQVSLTTAELHAHASL